MNREFTYRSRPSGYCVRHVKVHAQSPHTNGAVRQASLHASDSACEHSSQPIGVEAGAKDGLNLVLEDSSDLIPAKIGHGCR